MDEKLRIKDVLIIRSTHLEHLDLVLKRVGEAFPQARICVLTHSHARESIGDKRGISVIPYEESGDFSIFKMASLQGREIMKRGVDLVVLPFNNESGSGYLNVVLFAFGIKAPLRMSCTRSGQLERMGYGYLTRRLVVATLASLFAIVSTAICVLPTLFFIQLVLRFFSSSVFRFIKRGIA